MFKSFTPVPLQLSALNTLNAWYDASVPESIVSSSGVVSQWNDLSGNGRHATQTTSARRPTTGSSTINGLNVITFNAASTQFINLPASGVINDLTSGSITMFLVGLRTTAAMQQFIFGTSGNQRFSLASLAATNFAGGFYGPGTSFPLSSSVSTSAAPFIALSSVDGATDTVTLTVNNGTPATGTKAFTGTPDSLNFGSFSAGVNNFFTGNIGEVLFFDSILSASSTLAVFQYLGTKWGVTV